MRGPWLLPLAWLVGCAPAGSPGRGMSPTSAEHGGTAFEGRGAETYSTRPIPVAARGGPDAERIDLALLDVARARKIELIGDGRLAELATLVGSTIEQGNAPASSAVDAYARHLGLVEPVPFVEVFSLSKEAATSQALEEVFGGLPKNIAFNRYGIAVVPRFGQRMAVIVLSAVEVDIEPVARRVSPGSTLALRGRLRNGYKHPQLEITLPNGSVKHVAEKAGSHFDFAAPMALTGVHRLEILADGPLGTRVLANFPVFAGVDEPAVVAGGGSKPGPPIEPGDEKGVAAKLLALLNEARKAALVAPLKEHPGLSEVAAAHSRDMVESGFFGHVSPKNGDAASRVRRKGLAFLLIAENLGRGSNADEVHAMLLDSPGHRANALDPNLGYVGIGVVIDKRGGLSQIVATEEFAGGSKPVDVGAVPDDLLRAINARRASSGANPLQVDPVLADAARRGAALYFKDPSLSQEQVLQNVTRDIERPSSAGGSSIGRRMRETRSYVMPVISIDQVTRIDSLFDPVARYVGIGAAQGARPETGPHTVGVVVVLGWPR